MNSHKEEFGIKQLTNILSSQRWIGMMFVLPLLAMVHSALAQTPNANFDHIKTGFKLEGTHAQLQCGSCHIRGVFKGTPRDCAGCHKSGSHIVATAKPSNHVPTTSWPSCDSCHKLTTSFANAMLHNSVFVTPGSCATCHNSTMATGKPSGHVSTTAVCDSCHKSTSTWAGAGFNHTGVAPGTCATCHNGTTALGKTSNHVPTTSWPSCDSCHKSTTSFANAKLHSSVTVTPGSCATCHNGTMATGKPTNHIPYTTQLLNGASMTCDACHLSTTSWISVKTNHNNSQGNGSGWCKGCHASGTSYGGSADKKSLTHQSGSATDCSQSGCHRPLGSKGTTYVNWN